MQIGRGKCVGLFITYHIKPFKRVCYTEINFTLHFTQQFNLNIVISGSSPPVQIILAPEVKSVDHRASEAKVQPITRMFTAPRYSLRPRHWTKAAPRATWRRSRRCWWACTQRSPMVWRCRWHEVDSCTAAMTPCTDDQKQLEPQIDAACMENGESTRRVKTSNIPTEVLLRLNTMRKIRKGSAFDTFYLLKKTAVF